MILPDGTSLQSLGLPPEQIWPVPAHLLAFQMQTPLQSIVIPFSDAEREELATDGCLIKRMISDPWQSHKTIVELLFYVPREWQPG